MSKPKIESVNQWLTAVQSIAVIVGVILALVQLNQLVQQTKLQNDTLQHTQKQDSASLGLQFEDRLNTTRYDAISNAIQLHDQYYPLLASQDGRKSGAFMNSA